MAEWDYDRSDLVTQSTDLLLLQLINSVTKISEKRNQENCSADEIHLFYISLALI